MHYEEHAPSSILRPFVECIWTLSGTAIGSPAEPDRILPDGCMELIFHRGDPFLRGSEVQPHSFIVGQMIEPAFVTTSNRVEVLGIRFQPGGAYPFFAVSMRELANRFISTDVVWGTLGKELEERIRNAASIASATQIAVRELERRLKTVHSNSLRTRDLAVLQVGRHGTIPVRELAAQAGISERQLEREFSHVVGLTPKVFSRILRFQRVFNAVERDCKWVDVAFECGYFDQSHLIADFRRFAGSTPASFDLDRFELGRHFLRARRDVVV